MYSRFYPNPEDAPPARKRPTRRKTASPQVALPLPAPEEISLGQTYAGPGEVHARGPVDPYASVVPTVETVQAPVIETRALPAHVILVSGEAYGFYERYLCESAQECEKLVGKLMGEIDRQGVATGRVVVLAVMRTKSVVLLMLEQAANYNFAQGSVAREWTNTSPDQGMWGRYWAFRAQG